MEEDRSAPNEPPVRVRQPLSELISEPTLLAVPDPTARAKLLHLALGRPLIEHSSAKALPYRTPVVAAKEMATLDWLSRGRFFPAVGVGVELPREFDASGIPFKERGRRTDEALELFRKVWTEREPEIETRGHRLRGVVASPMPLQRPRPPIWIGGASDGAYRRVARHGDGWHSTAATPEAFRQGADAVRRHWAEARREGEPVLSLRIPFWLDGIHRPGSDMSYLRGRHAIHGAPRQVVDILRGYAALGVSHAALDVSLTTYPAILETIDVLAREVRPALGA